jgi:hypothetical protein
MLVVVIVEEIERTADGCAAKIGGLRGDVTNAAGRVTERYQVERTS